MRLAARALAPRLPKAVAARHIQQTTLRCDPSSQDRARCCAIVLAVSPAPASYCASGLILSGPRRRLEDVCYSPLSGDKQMSSKRAKNDASDPHRKLAIHHFWDATTNEDLRNLSRVAMQRGPRRPGTGRGGSRVRSCCHAVHLGHHGAQQSAYL